MNQASTRVQLTPGKKLLLAVVLAVAAMVVLDTLFRVYLYTQGQPCSPSGVRAQISGSYNGLTQRIPEPGRADARTADNEVLRDVVHPFVGFDLVAGFNLVNRDLAYFATDHRDTDHVIAILGGSVAGGFSNDDRYFTAALRADPRFATRRIKVIGCGRGGYKQPQQVMMLGYLLSLGYQLDGVVNIDGFNEAALSCYNVAHGVHPVQPSIYHWAKVLRFENEAADAHLLELRLLQRRAKIIADEALTSWRALSAVLGHRFLREMAAVQGRYAEELEGFTRAQVPLADQRIDQNPAVALRGPTIQPGWAANLPLVIDSWEDASVTLEGMCRAHGIQYLHVLQPTLHDPGSKPLTQEEVARGQMVATWMEGVHSCYPLFRERGKQLRARGVAFADLSYAFQDVTESVYADCCHFAGGNGAELFARAVAKAYLEGVK